MRLIVYGDFTCPYSYLAGQRADELVARGAADIEWRAVEHDPRLSMTGTPAGADPRWQRDVDAAAALALPGERAPKLMPLVSNTYAAVSAYAEAVTDGVQDELRRALFTEIWARQRHLSGAYDVRSVVAGITRAPQPVGKRLGLELPRPGFGSPSPLRITRDLGATISFIGAPLTTTGWRRMQEWRREWLAIDQRAKGAEHALLTHRAALAVVGPDESVRTGADALAYMGELLVPDTAAYALAGFAGV